eukprot:12404167-Karenia_brevis.AAC.1
MVGQTVLNKYELTAGMLARHNTNEVVHFYFGGVLSSAYNAAVNLNADEQAAPGALHKAGARVRTADEKALDE